MFKKFLSLLLIILLAISSIGACSASDGLTPYHWTLKGSAVNWWNWEGYDNYTPWYYYNSYGYYQRCR